MDRKDIIDHMLSVIGEGAVSSLATTHPSAINAMGILNTEDLEFQGRGWWFNTEYRLKLVPDEIGRVSLPSNTLDCALSDVSILPSAEKNRYVRRGSYIYDTIKHTNIINTSVYVDLVLQLEIEDLPTVAASYLNRKAAQEMYLDDDGDMQKLNELGRRRAEAWQTLKAKELTVLAVTSQDNPVSQLLSSRMRPSFTNGNANLIGGRFR